MYMFLRCGWNQWMTLLQREKTNDNDEEEKEWNRMQCMQCEIYLISLVCLFEFWMIII